MLDSVIPFQLEKSNIRGRVVRLDTALKTIIKKHNYPPIVNHYLAEAIVLSVALSDCFKFDGLFTLQISGDGPLRLLVVDIDENKNLRACARFDPDAIEQLNGKTSLHLQHIFGAGYMAFTIDPRAGNNSYQGTVELIGTSLAEATHHFFRQSEQLETGVVIKVNSDMTTEGSYAGGVVMIQRLPLPTSIDMEEKEELDDRWIHSMSLISSVSSKELLDGDLSTNDLLYRLFWEYGVRVQETRTLVAQCRCSKEKITTMLSTFALEQLKEMVFNGKIEVTCEFCGEAYVFPEEQISELAHSQN